jgi:hypothetical protein
MCKNNACGCNGGSRSWLATALAVALCAVALGSAAEFITAVLTVLLVGAIAVVAAMTAFLVLILRRDGATWRGRGSIWHPAQAGAPFRIRTDVTAAPGQSALGTPRAALTAPSPEVHVITDIPARATAKGRP